MSLLVVWCSPNRAIVAVDTLARLGNKGGMPLQVSKAAPFVHAPAILAARGDAWVLNMAWLLLAMQFLCDTDALERAMPDALRRLSELLPGRARELGIAQQQLERQELVLAGWSPTRQRMIAMSYVQMTYAEGFVAEPILDDDDYIAPWDDVALGEPPVPSSIENVQIIARASAALWRAKETLAPIGGRLLVAEVTQAGIAMRDGGSLED